MSLPPDFIPLYLDRAQEREREGPSLAGSLICKLPNGAVVAISAQVFGDN